MQRKLNYFSKIEVRTLKNVVYFGQSLRVGGEIGMNFEKSNFVLKSALFFGGSICVSVGEIGMNFEDSNFVLKSALFFW